MRDSYYGVSGGAYVLPNASATRVAAEWMFEHARPGDGAMPQSVPPDGAYDSFYEWGQRCNQTPGAPMWRSCIDLDSGPFAITMASAVIAEMPPADGIAWYEFNELLVPFH